MSSVFFPDARPMLIGSQPLDDHAEALEQVFKYVGEIPNWVQLPLFPGESMVPQFAAGLPGLVHTPDALFVDSAAPDFEPALLAFFEEYLSIEAGDGIKDTSRFALTPQTAKGFFSLLDGLARGASHIKAVKGQVTGPITFCTAVKDQDGRAIFYHDGLRDAAVKLLALKANWQAKKLSDFAVPVIIFIDEPALAGYGSSELISISQEQITGCIEEVISAVHNQGGLAGIHVCANTDWSLLLTSGLDIINFDAFGYFDKFILYGDQIKAYLDSGRYLAWGLVPTLRSEEVEAVDLETLWQLWQRQRDAVLALGVKPDVLRRQSFITPSCGTGSLPQPLSQKVLSLTQALSRRIRESTS